MKGYPNTKVDALIAGQISIDSSWSERDFADLALAAADQAGCSVGDQLYIEGILRDTQRPRLRRAR